MKRYYRPIIWTLAAFVLSLGSVGAQTALSNGDFEKGTKGQVPAGWFLPAVCEQQGYMARIVTEGAQAGKQCALLATSRNPDANSFGNLMQAVLATPYVGKRVRFHASVRVEPGARAQLWMRVDRDNNQMGFFDNMGDRPITAPTWQTYEIVGDIDKDARDINIGLMLIGKGKVWIDNVSLTVVGADAKPTGKAAPGPGLRYAKGGYEFTALGDVAEPKIAFPMPLPFENQVPLTYDLKITPPETVKQVIYKERTPQNWIVEVHFNPLKAGQKVTLKWYSDVLVRPRNYDSLPASVATTKLAQLPPEVKPWLANTRCVQRDHPEITAQAKKLRAEDVMQLARNIAQLPQSLKAGNFQSLDAVEALRHSGSCTSMANLAAAMFRANGVPTRILACYPTWAGPLQTHYIVQFYVPDYGWVWLESTTGDVPRLPYQDVIVAIVNPDDEERSFQSPRWAAQGVPYMTLTENLGAPQFAVTKMLVAPEKSCDHVAGITQTWTDGDAKRWDSVFTQAQGVWTATLAHLQSGRPLPDEVAAAQKEAAAAKSLDALASRLETCQKTIREKKMDLNKPGWELTFHDEFDGAKLDTTKWIDSYPDNERTHSNNEQQYYAEDGWEVKDGKIRFKAEKRSKGGMPYTSGMISSYGKFAQQYGWFEIRAKFPKGKGMWPAFWLLPTTKGWPPEIDILEILGHETDKIYFSTHYGTADKHQYKTLNWKGVDFAKDFHTIALEWKSGECIWYVDGKERARSSEGVPSEPMYILANLAVGGDWPGMPDATTPFPGYMDIDYIRVYKRKTLTP